MPISPAKAAKNPIAKKSPKQSLTGVYRDRDVKWNEKKAKVLKALVALRATNFSTCLDSGTIAKKAGLTPRQVRHYGYHAASAGLVTVHEVVDQRGYGFSITKKGIAEIEKNK